jgi:hypothetical protein
VTLGWAASPLSTLPFPLSCLVNLIDSSNHTNTPATAGSDRKVFLVMLIDSAGNIPVEDPSGSVEVESTPAKAFKVSRGGRTAEPARVEEGRSCQRLRVGLDCMQCTMEGCKQSYARKEHLGQSITCR